MKVVINKCYGGFGLSRIAVEKLIGCPHVKLEEPGDYYGNRPGWEKHFEEDQKSEYLPNFIHEGKIVCDEHRDDAARGCPALVAVVQVMGALADGDYAKLKVVEVPDDVEWELTEYDGIEQVAARHAKWG
jgi:hypothetical protein